MIRPHCGPVVAPCLARLRREKRHREEHQGGHEEAEGDSEEETGGEDCENEKLGFFDGTGLYSLACMMNHSCEPSVKVLYPEDGMGRGEARIVTLGQLQEGQELLISYIDTRWTRSRRQRELLDGYRFECRCERCNREGQEEAS